MSVYQGVFKTKYSLRGKDWIRLLTPEDFRFFIHMGMEAMQYGHKGGIARSRSATRDPKGRFAREQ